VSCSDRGHSYEPFSRAPEYIDANRLFIQSLDLGEVRRVADLACGAGTLAGLLLEEFGSTDSPASIFGLDISQDVLHLARDHLSGRSGINGMDGGDCRIALIRATADRLPLADRSVDAVVIGNAIQLFDDKRVVLREANRILVPGGRLAFNTSFYAGTFAPGTERFYLRWVEKAAGELRRQDAELREQGREGIIRQRGRARPAFSRPWLSRDEYEALLDRHGFGVVSVTERTVNLTRSSLEAIGSYAGLADVLLSGYPVDHACEALKKSVRPSLDAAGLEVIPRFWIEFIGKKI
jgi:ubiquinone/menaquinone biosynthesis C-methylase UbiE